MVGSSPNPRQSTEVHAYMEVSMCRLLELIKKYGVKYGGSKGTFEFLDRKLLTYNKI